MMDLGALRIVQLHDGYGAIDGNRVFYPATQDEWGEGTGADPTGFMLNAYQPLLINEAGLHTLVDTGFGQTNPGRRRDMQDDLRSLGLAREDIRRVIITHAHGDHIGGNTLLVDGKYLPAYPNAEYVVQQSEIASLQEEGGPVWQQRFAPLQSSGQLHVVDGEVSLTQAITLWPIAGHTAGQQAVCLQSEGAQAIFVGDLGLSIKSFARPDWGPSWAWSREADQANRRRIAEWAIETGALVMLYHEPRTPWFRIRRATAGNGDYCTIPE